MAKGKKQSKCPQAQHKLTSRSSQHDKRKWLDTPNLQRKKTAKAKVPLTGAMADLVKSMAGMLELCVAVFPGDASAVGINRISIAIPTVCAGKKKGQRRS